MEQEDSHQSFLRTQHWFLMLSWSALIRNSNMLAFYQCWDSMLLYSFVWEFLHKHVFCFWVYLEPGWAKPCSQVWIHSWSDMCLWISMTWGLDQLKYLQQPENLHNFRESAICQQSSIQHPHALRSHEVQQESRSDLQSALGHVLLWLPSYMQGT